MQQQQNKSKCIEVTNICNGKTVYQKQRIPIISNMLHDSIIDISDNPIKTKIGEIPLSSTQDAIDVVNAAHQAFNNGLGEWPMSEQHDRMGVIDDFIYGMQQKKDILIQLLMWEIGKTYSDATLEFERTIEYMKKTIDFYCNHMVEGKEKDISSNEIEGIIQYQPKGVVLCMMPYNYPLNEGLTLILPALLTGNTVVTKPARIGVLTLGVLFPLFLKYFPAGVVNTITDPDGRQTISAIMQTGKVDVLSFIGGENAAKAIIAHHPEPHKLHLFLGLGAKNPVIITDTFTKRESIQQFIPQIVKGALSFNGQRCTAHKIIFAHESIADMVAEEVAAYVDTLPLGMPWEFTNDELAITPLCDENSPIRMKDYISNAVLYGAKVINMNGGKMLSTSLMRPAVLYPVTNQMRIYYEEQFGPIIPIVSYTSEDEIIAWQKQQKYKQQAAVFTSNPFKDTHFINTLSALVHRVNINEGCRRGPDSLPFSGMGDSGKGVVSIEDTLREFTIPKVQYWHMASWKLQFTDPSKYSNA